MLPALKDKHIQDPTQFHLSVGAIVRLGKGIINDMAYERKSMSETVYVHEGKFLSSDSFGFGEK